MSAWPGPPGECRHWWAQPGGRGRAGGGWLRTVGRAVSMPCTWSRRWPLPSAQQTGPQGPGPRVSPSLGRGRGGAFENLFSEPFAQRLSSPHFQKVPQLSEAVISRRKSVQPIMCIRGPLIPSGGLRCPVLSLVPSCRQALPASLIRLSTPVRPPSDQPLDQAGPGPPS